MEILFNYLGQYQQLERSDSLFWQEPRGRQDVTDVAPEMPRFALFETGSCVVDNRLLFQFHFQSPYGPSIWHLSLDQEL